jgi:hypothetical protein
LISDLCEKDAGVRQKQQKNQSTSIGTHQFCIVRTGKHWSQRIDEKVDFFSRSIVMRRSAGEVESMGRKGGREERGQHNTTKKVARRRHV